MVNEKVPELNDNEFEDFIKQDVVLVDFFAEWCMPCVMMAPIIDDLSDKFKGKVKFGKVNTSDVQKIAEKFNVRSIPHFIIFKNGEIAEEFTGSLPLEEIEAKLNKFI
jgi:thioredoxin 1